MKKKSKKHPPQYSVIFIAIVTGISSTLIAYGYFTFFRYDPNEQHVQELNKFSLSKQPPIVNSAWVKLANDSIAKNKNCELSLNSINKLKINESPLIYTDCFEQTTDRWLLFDLNLWDYANHYNVNLNGTRCQLDPTFILGNEREKGGMLGSARDTTLFYTNMSLKEFLSTTFEDNKWFYWTGSLREWEDILHNDLTTKVSNNSLSWESFRVIESDLLSSGFHVEGDGVDRANGRDGENEGIWNPMLWLSHPGVVAQTHYDPQHNMFIQLQGIKRFTLFSPDTEFYFYPNIHRSYRQSQIHLDNDRPSMEDRFPLVTPATVEGATVLLYPGDVLYIPPYWQHRVESLTLSLSLSILSPSHLEASFAEVYWERVPFGRFQSSLELRKVAVRLYFTLLFDQLRSAQRTHSIEDERSSSEDGRFALKGFGQWLYQTRFEPLSSTLPSSTDQSCGPISMEDILTAVNQPENASNIEEIPMDLIIQQFENFASSAERVAKMLSEIKSKYQIQLVLNFLGDYVEQIVRWAVGPRNTSAFINKCLQ